jgi:hypothetical protein
MKTIVRLFLLLFTIVPSLMAQPPSYDQIVSLWSAKKYDEALPLLLAYRKEPFGRKWQVDYMIGTSQCHGSHPSNRGVAYLNNVLVYKQIPDSARSATEQEIQFCLSNSHSTLQPAFELIPVSGQVTDPATVSGKGGYNFSSGSSITNALPKLTPVPIADLKKRVFQTGQETEALAAAKQRLGGSPKGVAENGFVVVCSGFCAFPLAEVPRCLQRFEPPLHDEFDLLIPDHLVTVYIPEEIGDVPRLAQTLHGVTLPLGTLAYSVLEDLSIVGIYISGCGSLAHELVHLAIRNNFGDSPAWLEEGLASEIAVSGPQPHAFRFGSSWRDSTLRKQWKLRPKVAQLLAMNWSDFAARDAASVDRVAATHAMAAVFIRYLDEKKKLRPIYLAVRDGRFPADGGPPLTDVAIVEGQLGQTIAAIDKDFETWFQHQTQ